MRIRAMKTGIQNEPSYELLISNQELLLSETKRLAGTHV